MSWDVFVQDLPRDAQSVSGIPADFSPKVLGTRAWVLAAIADVVPSADFADPTWIRISTPEADLEINLGREDPVSGFAFHIRGGTHVVGLVADILTKLDLRALDPGAETGIFDPRTVGDSLRRWQAYRHSVANDK
jgi:hypothetical protein